MTCIQPLPVVEAESLRVPVHVRALQDESTDLNHRDQRVHALDCHGALTFHWQLQKSLARLTWRYAPRTVTVTPSPGPSSESTGPL